MPQASGLQFTARIGGLPRDFFTVVGFELTESLSSLSFGRLDLASSFSDISASDVLKQPVDLVVWQDGEPLWRLGLMHNSRIFQTQRVRAASVAMKDYTFKNPAPKSSSKPVAVL